MVVPHLALNFRARHQGRDTVDHHNVHRIRANQSLGDLQRLLARVRLAHIEIAHVYPNLLSIGRIQRVLDIHKTADPSLTLRLRDRMQTERGLPRAFWPVNFDDAAAWISPYPQGKVQTQAPAGDRFDLKLRGVPQLHDDPIPIFFVQVDQRRLQRLHLPNLRLPNLHLPNLYRILLLACLCHGCPLAADF